MRELLNEHSFLVTAAPVVFLTAALAWRYARSWRRWRIIALALVGLASFQVIMATRGGTVDLPGLRSGIGAGKPTLVEFYSNLLIVCLSAKPTVDGLEAELKDKARVIRLNVHSELGQQARKEFRVDLVPTFIVLDDAGNEVWRQSGRLPDRKRILETISRPDAPQRPRDWSWEGGSI